VSRIACVVTARPSWSRVRTALAACRARGLEVHVIAAASACVWKYGKVADIIREEGYPVTELSSVVEGTSGRTAAISTGLLLAQLPLALETVRPELVITIADRHETIATALAARNLGIPLLHLQGGERSGSIDDRIRDAVTQLSDIHCVSNGEAAREVLLARTRDEHWFYSSKGAEEHGVHVTGCPSIDLAAEALRLGPLDGERGYVVVLQHPVTEEAAQAAAQMRATIEGVKRAGYPAKWFWPGEDAGADAMAKEMRMAELEPTRNVDGVDFLRLLLGARCIVGNSSVAIRECSFLGVPAVNIGTRQAGRQRGVNVVNAPHDSVRIWSLITHYGGLRYPTTHLYGDGRAGERVADVIVMALARTDPTWGRTVGGATYAAC
jgi:UDP-hydrolysing UDP-N-acetyl-D-glucosamine 2-epimerase